MMAPISILRPLRLSVSAVFTIILAGWLPVSHAFDREQARHDLGEALDATLELVDEAVVETKEGADIRRRWMVLLQPRFFSEYEIVHRCSVTNRPGSRQVTRFRFTASPTISTESANYDLARSANFFQDLVRPGEAPPFDQVILVFEVDDWYAGHEFWFDRLQPRDQQPAWDFRKLPAADIAVENKLSSSLEIEHISASGFHDAAGRPTPISVDILFRALSPGVFNLSPRVEDTSNPADSPASAGIPLVILRDGALQYKVIEPAKIVRTDGDGRKRSRDRQKILPTARVVRVGDTFRVCVGHFSFDSPRDKIRVVLSKAPFQPDSHRVGDLIPWKDY
jgi:hypothetical protein